LRFIFLVAVAAAVEQLLPHRVVAAVQAEDFNAPFILTQTKQLLSAAAVRPLVVKV
jgi:hypothetical protein